MNNVWTIFKNDLKHLGKNSISWVVVIGLIVIPSLYAWLCVYAFWDPYNNTENLKVAVASVDEGYESSLVPVRLNLGKEILQELADNRQLDWVFVDRKEAVEGVKSGKYYAALVIPKDFSRNLLSILSDDVQSAEILYYLNEKENAIAAKVSSQGASTIQNTIDEVVAETATEIALNSLGTLSDVLEDQDTQEVVENIRQKMQGLSVKLDSSADMMDRLCEMNTTLNSLLKATDELLTEMGANTSAAVQDLESTDQSFHSLESDLNVMNAKMDAVLQNTEQVYTDIDNSAAQYLSNMNADASTISQSLNKIGRASCRERV